MMEGSESLRDQLLDLNPADCEVCRLGKQGGTVQLTGIGQVTSGPIDQVCFILKGADSYYLVPRLHVSAPEDLTPGVLYHLLMKGLEHRTADEKIELVYDHVSNHVLLAFRRQSPTS